MFYTIVFNNIENDIDAFLYAIDQLTSFVIITKLNVKEYNIGTFKCPSLCIKLGV